MKYLLQDQALVRNEHLLVWPLNHLRMIMDNIYDGNDVGECYNDDKRQDDLYLHSIVKPGDLICSRICLGVHRSLQEKCISEKKIFVVVYF